MSACISRHGEYSDHLLAETGASERFVCSRCFALAESELLAALDAAERDRDALIGALRDLRALLATKTPAPSPDST